MTNVQSKYLRTVTCTCKDFHHPWTDKCMNAIAGMMLAAIPYCLRVYTVFYMLSFIMRRGLPTLADIKKTVNGIMQSTAFLVTNSFSFAIYNCSLRHLLGCYYMATVAFLPAFLASFTSILVERPARRPLLALYVANVATEAVWNMAEARGLVRSVPNGQVAIFGISVSVLLYMYRLGLHRDHCKDSLFKILGIFVGATEEGPVRSTIPRKTTIEHSRESRQMPANWSIAQALQVYRSLLVKLKSKHASCPHREPCLRYALVGGVKSFVGGVALQVILKLLMNLNNVIQMRLNWRKAILNKKTIQLGTFLGGLSLLYKSMSCLLRCACGFDDARFAIPAGMVASIAYAQYPDITIALYMMWQMLQIVYNLGIKKGKLPKVPGFTIFLYCFSTAILFHAGILEPKCLRPSYYKFVQAISGGRLGNFNFKLVDGFGLRTSQNAYEVMQSLNTLPKSTVPRFPL